MDRDAAPFPQNFLKYNYTEGFGISQLRLDKYSNIIDNVSIHSGKYHMPTSFLTAHLVPV